MRAYKWLIEFIINNLFQATFQAKFHTSKLLKINKKLM